jgi:hypothetical protein
MANASPQQPETFQQCLAVRTRPAILLKGGFLLMVFVVLFQSWSDLPSVEVMNTKKAAQEGLTAGICAVAKFEEAYLQEWIDYHLGLGFSEITIYDNSRDFELQQFRQKRVRIVHDPTPGLQSSAYLDCARNNTQHEWLAFFDIDEFLRLYQHDHVVPFLKQHCERGALTINWLFMASGTPSGDEIQLAYRPRPVTSRFVRIRVLNDHVKSIARVADIDLTKRLHAHYPYLKSPPILHGTQHDTDKHSTQAHRNGAKPSDVAVFYHYDTKSWKEYISKRLRGRSDNVAGTVDDLDERLVRFAKNGVFVENGTIFDDSAWKLLKKMHPKYAMYDEDLSQMDKKQPATATTKTSVTGEKNTSLALCAIVLDDEAYVDEFVDYHHALGFDHFYIYDIADRLNLHEMEQWGRHKGPHVTVKIAKSTTDLAAVYRGCVEAAAASKLDWIAFWDVNEFLVLGDRSMTDLVADGQKKQDACVAIPRLLFGTSRVDVYKPLPVLKRFQYRQDAGEYGQKFMHRLQGENKVLVEGKTPSSCSTTYGGVALHWYIRSKKECNQWHFARNRTNEVCFINGTVHDSLAWDTLKQILPNYAGFDQF